MKTHRILLSIALIAAMLLTVGCSAQPGASTPEPQVTEIPSAEEHPTPAPEAETPALEAPAQSGSQVADASQMAPVEDVVEDNMVPIYGESLQDGVYDVTVDSSSSMFKITQCELTMESGQMTAVMHMGGTGYLKVFLGTGEQAAAAGEDACIAFEEQSDGTHTFTIPVEALDMGIACAAYSKNKELWYDRTLVFRADSLPRDAFVSGLFVTAESLGLADGNYTVDVHLEGGSGRAGVESPAKLRVENGAAYATIVWSSSNYDYMRLDDEKYLPLNTEGNSTFEVPVIAFDSKVTYFADTTAMSTPHEIEYTLYFDSATITEAQ